MGKIVTVGGVNSPSSLDLIDEEIIKLTNKRTPNILFVPTASGDDPGYIERYRGIYEGRFGCKLDVLPLVSDNPTENIIREKIFSSEIVYIGGGPTSSLMYYFRSYNMIKILKEAYDREIVLAGISAGAICWGKHYFYTEYPEGFCHEGFTDFIKVDCMGFLNYIIMPHYNLPGYPQRLDLEMGEYNMTGIGIDNNCAIEFVDETYRVISTNENARVYRLYRDGTNIIKEEIIKENGFKDIINI